MASLTTDAEWLTEVSCEKLTGNGVVDVGAEQTVLLCERNALHVKSPTQEMVVAKLKGLYNHNTDFPFTNEVSEFATQVAFLLDQSPIDELEERAEVFDEILVAWESGLEDHSYHYYYYYYLLLLLLLPCCVRLSYYHYYCYYHYCYYYYYYYYYW